MNVPVLQQQWIWNPERGIQIHTQKNKQLIKYKYQTDCIYVCVWSPSQSLLAASAIIVQQLQYATAQREIYHDGDNYGGGGVVSLQTNEWVKMPIYASSLPDSFTESGKKRVHLVHCSVCYDNVCVHTL